MGKNLWITRRGPVQVIHNLRLSLTYRVRFLRCKRAPKGDSSLRLRKLRLGLCLFLGSFTIQITPSYADINAVDAYKIYAHIKIGSFKQFVCLEKLWTKESNWNYKARNKRTGAHGIPQALPADKMDVVGTDWRTNPVTQIRWGLRYVDIRYDSPCNAWSKFKRSKFY